MTRVAASTNLVCFTQWFDNLSSELDHRNLLGQSPALQAVARQIELVAPTGSAVLILGESGTGKEVVARKSIATADAPIGR